MCGIVEKPKRNSERNAFYAYQYGEKNEFSLPFRELEKDNVETLHRKPKTETNW